jgi:phosphoribosylaminoimidazolecarboxamide formyltransferase/IMP cyclohydrolase
MTTQPYAVTASAAVATTPIRRALISVADKSGIVDFARFLASRNVEILSTSGSAQTLAKAGIPVKEVSAYTGFPEIMGGRVKTLHPKIHGGLLARRDSSDHCESMNDYSIFPIDLLVSNLYPFETAVATGANYATAIENIDVGGVAMIRAAAKNHMFVTVVTDPAWYSIIMDEMVTYSSNTSLELRKRLATAAFARVAAYDSAIASWLAVETGDTFPEKLYLTGSKILKLRYGENPHQEAALYQTGCSYPSVVSACQIQGKELSYNNINDSDAALELISEFEETPAIAIIKHANPCGVAIADTLALAYTKALSCDPVSAFGGIVAANRALDMATARELAELFLEVVIVPSLDEEARAILSSKKNLRLLVTGGLPDSTAASMVVKSVRGGLLLQTRDNGQIDREAFKVVTQRIPTEAELADLEFAFRVCKHVKSNAIVYAYNGATVGIGGGQMSRVDSARIATFKAKEAVRSAGKQSLPSLVAASDAFFPFSDGLLVAIEMGVTAVVQPGGSVRDLEVIEAADQAGIAMVFTGIRHFRH